jgi:hypothetical protein
MEIPENDGIDLDVSSRTMAVDSSSPDCRNIIINLCSQLTKWLPGDEKLPHSGGRGRRSPSSPRPADLYIPKNRSTGNLLAQRAMDKPRIRFSFDAGLGGADLEALSMSVSPSIRHVPPGDSHRSCLFLSDVGKLLTENLSGPPL